MQNLTNLILLPVVVIVIGLIIEYWVIQPIRKKSEVAIPSSPMISKGWATAIRRGIKQFKVQQTGYIWHWWSRNRNTITIEAWKIEKGCATLTLAVSGEYKTVETPVPGVIQFVTKQRVAGVYELIIDRTGDILRMDSLPFTSVQSSTSPNLSQEDLPETKLTIKNRKRPVVEKKNGEVKVIIEFDVENSGKVGKACPYVEFQVVTIGKDGKLAPQPFRSEPESYDIPALTIVPFRLKYSFHSPDWPLVGPSDKVRVELFPYPSTASRPA